MSKCVKLFDLLNEYPNNIDVIKTKYLELLVELTIVTNIETTLFTENIATIHKMGCIIVKYISSPGLDDFTIIASGTIIIEPKIIRGGKSVGHIEDIVIKKEYRGNKIAQEILEQLKGLARDNNCYKIILDCNENVKKVYENYGFEEKGCQMAVYM
jgi:glucosamine-phosphate N-acetyltransferase